jgi:ribosomal-protein-alanine N-acetyltransferase
MKNGAQQKMKLQVTKLTEQHCKEICSWHYDAPYDIYNWPSWGHMLAKDLQFADPQIRETQFAGVVRVVGEDNAEQDSRMVQVGITEQENKAELVGYVQFFPMYQVTRLGLGIRPDLCDKGLGATFMQTILNAAKERNPTHEIDLEVHIWNERAQKTYAKAGFVRTDEYERMTTSGMERFYCMVYIEQMV